MFYIADLHLHSHYSRATSKDLNLESLYQWARIKGIHVVGTGDFTHPEWFKELKEKLEPDGTGLFRLKNPPADVPGFKCHDIDVRFCLTSEISSIYKHGDKVRKNHNCVYAPDFDTVTRISAKLARIGNLASDGRPILGLPARDLLEIVLETSDHAHLIPAHIWTPWFSMLGSKSGYDSVKECFRDLAGNIFALETGLSSDPEMNWRLSMLDGYTLVSNSDAHSPQKLGREANLFDTERSYYALFDALKTKKGFLGTYEFFPEEGKYHMDGHRNCNIRLDPEESRRLNNRCPVCGKELTIGVYNRLTTLADRTLPQRPEGAADFHYIIPLPEILGEIKGSSPSSKGVMQHFQRAVSSFGSEFTLLKEAPVEDIEKNLGPVLAEAIRRMRTQQVDPQGGYDGEYGTIKIFKEGEIDALTGQSGLFGAAPKKTTKRKVKETKPVEKIAPVPSEKTASPQALNEEQQSACTSDGAVLVTAGPGTGKTKTLISWMAHRIRECQTPPQELLAVTFTNKAADELKERLETMLGDQARGITVGTFHGICFSMLQERYENLHTVYDDESRQILLGMLFPEKSENELKKLSVALREYFEQNDSNPQHELFNIAGQYRERALHSGGVDVSDIIGRVVAMWEAEPQQLETQRNRFTCIAADELQDINPVQYRFLQLLGKGKNMFAIGDPDQSIYGFRGSDVKLFFRFTEDFAAQEISLKQNYRSSGTIVNAAVQLIRNNTQRKDVPLLAQKNSGASLKLHVAVNEQDEANFIINEIENLIGGTHNLTSGATQPDGRYGFSDIAVLFRTRAIGKTLLHHFRSSGIPVRFGDASSFLLEPPFRLIANIFRLYLDPRNLVALDGVLTHGLKLDREAKKKFLSAYPAQGSFSAVFGEEWEKNFLHGGTAGAVRTIFEQFIHDSALDETGLLQKDAILQIAHESQADAERFLAQLTLDPYTDTARLKADAVKLLTFHASKGLEFPVVFIAGAEEGITPMLRKDSNQEEERRLFYVAMTRAKEELYITRAAARSSFGEMEEKTGSRFLDELPVELTEMILSKRKKRQEPNQLFLF